MYKRLHTHTHTHTRARARFLKLRKNNAQKKANTHKQFRKVNFKRISTSSITSEDSETMAFVLQP